MPDKYSGDNPSEQAVAQPLSQSQACPPTPKDNEMRQESDPNADNKGIQTANLERDIKMGEISLIIINGLLLITSIVIACIYYGQLQQMTRATKATEQAAKAAQESADLSRQQIISSQAAILGVRFDILYRFIPDEAHGLRFLIDYPSGSAMATNIHASIDASWKDARDLKDIGNIEHIEFDVPAMRSGKSIVKMVPLTGLNENTWPTIEKSIGHRTIGVKGTIRYNNGFEAIPDQSFCFIWYAHPQVLGNSAQGFIECERYASVVSMFSAFEKAEGQPQK